MMLLVVGTGFIPSDKLNKILCGDKLHPYDNYIRTKLALISIRVIFLPIPRITHHFI